MDKVNQYVKMMKELGNIRHKHKFNNSKEEDEHVKNMDVLWDSMTKQEQDLSYNLHHGNTSKQKENV